MLLAFVIMISAMSCNTEELFIEPVGEEIINLEDEEEILEEDAEPEVDPTLPCDFNLNTIEANATILINCIMDLQVQTINVPANVSILYEGGDIINGTLNFSDNAIISGELLNYTLILTGSNPRVKDPTFNFIPERWGIVEGETTSEIAQRNNNILEGTMFSVKELGVTTFKIDKLDAYFEISKVTSTTSNQNWYPSIEAINIPSDFNLFMTDNTIIRTQPNSRRNSGTLMAVRDVSNVTVTGGILYGDRDTHNYVETGEDGQLLFMVHGANNIILDGIKMTMGSAGGLNINALNFSFQTDYKPSFVLYEIIPNNG